MPALMPMFVPIEAEKLAQLIRAADAEEHPSRQAYLDLEDLECATIDGKVNLVRLAALISQCQTCSPALE